MNISIYQYGLENSLKLAIKSLQDALEPGSSKKDKDNRINRAIGLITAAKEMVVVFESNDEESDSGDD